MERWTIAGLAACSLVGVVLVNNALGWLGLLIDPGAAAAGVISVFALVYFALLVLLLPAAPAADTLSIREYLVRVLVSSMFTILSFGLVYASVGIESSNGPTTAPQTALYFSMVTFSTLGYGDFAPKGDVLRLVAASQSIIGNLHLGLFVASAFYLLESSVPRPPDAEPGQQHPDPAPAPTDPGELGKLTGDDGTAPGYDEPGGEAPEPKEDEADDLEKGPRTKGRNDGSRQDP